MDSAKLNRFWIIAAFLLVGIITAGGLSIAGRWRQGQPVIISPPQPAGFSGEILIDGSVVNPGVYPWKDGDTLHALLQSSGGLTGSADLTRLSLYVPPAEEDREVQKIDINRAEAWLLEALPDIGGTRAQAIVEYRLHNGPFRHIEELTLVPGITRTTFEKLKDLVVVTN